MDIGQHIGLVRSIVAKMGVPVSDREDATQEGCVALIEKGSQWDPARGAWSTFASHVVRNAIRDYRRGQRRHDARVRGIVESTRESDISSSPPEISPDLQRGLDALDPRSRMIVTLRFWEGLTLEEVATRIGLGKSRVAVLEGEALAKMRGLV